MLQLQQNWAYTTFCPALRKTFRQLYDSPNYDQQYGHNEPPEQSTVINYVSENE